MDSIYQKFTKKRILKSKKANIFLVSITLFFFVEFFVFLIPSAFSMEAERGEASEIQSSLFRVGFEIEFPSYGISKEGEDSSVAKIPILEDRKGVWVLYRDTLDSRVEKEYFACNSPGIWNLEFKTQGSGIALEDHEKLFRSAAEISKLVETLSNPQNYIDKQFGKKTYKAARLPKEFEREHDIMYAFPKSENLWLVRKSGERSDVVRPQITYQLPLSCLPYLFRHLYVLGSKMEIKNFFAKPDQWERIKNLHKEFPKPVDGLILLFDYYVDRLMCNKHSETEPGPKPSFSVMSRLSFKDMYNHLKPAEQEQFRQYVESHYASFECKGPDYLNQEDRGRPLIQAFEQATKDVTEYQKQIVALTKRNEGGSDDKIQAAIEFYQRRREQTQTLIDNYRQNLDQQKEALSQTLRRRINQPIKVCYAINRFGTNSLLETAEISFSMRDVLQSIVDPNFRTEIEIELPGGENFVQTIKKSDWFSSPFFKLGEDYSMGVLPYPATKEPVAVIEIRSYPTILDEIKYNQVPGLIEAEIKYLEATQKIFSDPNHEVGEFKKIELENLKFLAEINPLIINKLGTKGQSSLDKINSFYSE